MIHGQNIINLHESIESFSQNEYIKQQIEKKYENNIEQYIKSYFYYNNHCVFIIKVNCDKNNKPVSVKYYIKDNDKKYTEEIRGKKEIKAITNQIKFIKEENKL